MNDLSLMPFEQFINKSIALIVVNKDCETDVHVYVGEIIEDGGSCKFINKSNGWVVILDINDLNSIKQTPDVLMDTLLNAELYLTLNIMDIPSDAAKSMAITGMKW